MKSDDIFNAFSDIDEEFIARSDKSPVSPVRTALIAACCTFAAMILTFGVVKLVQRPAPKPGGLTAAASPRPTAETRPTQIPGGTTFSQGQLIHGWGFNMAMDTSPYIFEGECLSGPDPKVSSSVYSPMPSYVFRVERVFRGDLEPGDEILVRATDDFCLQAGKTHLLFAEPFASVFEQLERYYAPLAASREDRCGIMLGDGVAGLVDIDYSGVIAHLTEGLPEHPYTGTCSVIGEYCSSENLSAIAAYSELIVAVRADEVLANEFNARTTYRCTVTAHYKGSCAGTIEVTAFKNSMMIGGEYLLLLVKPDAASIGYTMSSVKSVLPLGGVEAQELLSLLK